MFYVRMWRRGSRLKDMELEITETKRLLIRDSGKAVIIYYQEWKSPMNNNHSEWCNINNMRVEK